MKNFIFTAMLVYSLLVVSCGGNQVSDTIEKDTAHGVVVPPVTDSSGVITTPPINDSMSVSSDSEKISR